jgi:hypothetical protein
MNKGRKIVVCAREGGANTTPFMAAYFAKQNTKFGGGGKRGRAKIPSPQPPSFLPARAFQFCARSAQSFEVFVKKCSNFVQKTPPSFTFSEIERCCLGASRLGMVFFRDNPSIFEGERKRPLGNAEVPVRSTEKIEFSEPIFFLSPSAKGKAIFFAQKQYEY